MAVRDYIKVKTDSSIATKAVNLLAFRNAVALVLSLGPPLIETMEHNFDDSDPGNIIWTDLEALFGLPAGAGQVVFDMVNGVLGAMTGTMQNDQAENLSSAGGVIA